VLASVPEKKTLFFETEPRRPDTLDELHGFSSYTLLPRLSSIKAGRQLSRLTDSDCTQRHSWAYALTADLPIGQV
jgi:hypothetical protein